MTHSTIIIRFFLHTKSTLLLACSVIVLLSACSSSVRFSSNVHGSRSTPLLFSGTSTERTSSENKTTTRPLAESLKTTDMSFSGMASYYSDEFQGRKTANGERYDRAEFSAAHRSLPFGTLLKVRNPANERSVIVRVNDRGPFKETRVLDLSFAAAKELDLVRSGTAQIEATVLEAQ